MKVLVIGGTGESRDLAAELVARQVAVVTSLAGRVSQPALPQGRVVTGGFGGVEGLAAFLESEQVDRVVDASHPFAAQIGANAVEACARTDRPLLRLERPPWEPVAGDRWVHVSGADEAAAALTDVAGAGGTAFLTQGRRGLAPFATDEDREFLIRTVDPPAQPLPRRAQVILDRGPYTVYGETELMNRHGVAALVSKNSGGAMTSAKLTAARLLHVPVLMIDRPARRGSPAPVSVESVPAALDWLSDGVQGRQNRHSPPP